MSLNFEVSLSGLLTSQKGIKVVQNNIANANTDGYAREELSIVPNSAVSGSGVDNQIGTGVIAKEVNRIKDVLLSRQVLNNESQVGYYDSKKTILSNLETIMNETAEGSISDLLPKFFNSYENLAKFPEENSYRVALLGEAEKIVTKFNTIDTEMRNLTSQVENEIGQTITKVNILLEKIAQNNKELSKTTTENPNALYDQRDSYLSELSKYVDIDVEPFNGNNKLINVRVGGLNVVSGPSVSELKTMYLQDEDKFLLTSGTSVVRLKYGSLLGDLEMRNNQIPSIKQELDGFVGKLTSEINALHQVGFGIDNTTGNDFFVGSTMGSIKVAGLLKTNPEKIATSSTANTPGNGDIANKIAGLRNEKLMNGNTTNMVNYYNSFITDIAFQLNNHATNQQTYETVLMSMRSEQESIQGVNIDEEMANLLQFQKYYQSNAKMIQSIDKVYQSLLSIV